MNYAVNITASAEKDIARALDYIDYVIKNTKASEDLINEIDLKLNDLSLFPHKAALVDDPLLASLGIRFIKIKNYLAFYIISEKNPEIIILRFLYMKSDWISILKRNLSSI